MEIHCPLCDSTRITTAGLVRLADQIAMKAECIPCGERFCVDDNGNEVRVTEVVTE